MKKKALATLCTALLLVLSALEAGAGIKAAWEKPRGRKVGLEMTISEAVPALVIVHLKLPPALRIVRITPEPKKRDDKKGRLKLLFTDLRPGTNHVTMTADKKIGNQSITGTIMYKDPSSGTMERERISPYP